MIADRRSIAARRRSISLAAGALLVALALAPTPALAADPPTRGASAAGSAEAYWTEDRMRHAIPRDALAEGPDAAGGPSARFQPVAAGDVTGAEWDAGGAIVQRSGRILFTLGGSDYSCSGSVIDDGGDPTYSLVITAAHCAYDETADVFASNWIYIPAWDIAPGAGGCSGTPYGCWAARALVIHEGWADEEDLTVAAVQHDYAVAVLGAGGSASSQADALGAYPVRIGGVRPGDRLHAFGYPAATPYDGNELVYCLGAASVEPVAGSLGLTCDMTGGASGGPWLICAANPVTGAGEVASVSSYRMTGDPGLYAPVFDAQTRAVVSAARAATPDAVGIDGTIVAAVPPDPDGSPFTDTTCSTFRLDVEWLYAAGITSGCAPTRYCPTEAVTRGQMAAFLRRALHLPSTSTDYFTDDETSSFESDINALKAAGITSGCAPTRYCPTEAVTRGQMAAFLRRALHLPSTSTDYFTDDETSSFESDINALKAAGITSGCAPTRYCPTEAVTRGQMAAFLHRALP